MSTTLKTTLLLGLLTGLIMVIGRYFGGSQGMMLAFVFAGVMNFAAYWFSDKMVLRMYSAQPVDEAQAPELYRIVRNLAERNQIPDAEDLPHSHRRTERVCDRPHPEHAAVAVTEGILRLLRPEELEGVLAHELAHVRNRDTLTSTSRRRSPAPS